MNLIAMKLTLEQEVTLIDSVRDRPCLWDKRDDMFKNTKSKETAWKEVSVELLGALGPTDPGQEEEKEKEERNRANCVQKLWTGIRGQYAKFRKKLQKPTGSGASSKVYFRHENSMQFLLGSLEPSERIFTNIRTDDDHETFSLGEGSLSNIFNESSVDFLLNSETQNTGTSPFTAQSLVQSSTPQAVGRMHDKFAGKRKLTEFDKEVLKVMSKDEDEFDTFGSTIAQKLRKLASVSRRSFLDTQHKINSVIHEEELKQIDN